MSRLKHAPWRSLALCTLPYVLLFAPIWASLELVNRIPASGFDQPLHQGLYLGWVAGLGGYCLAMQLISYDRFIEMVEPGLWYLETIHWPVGGDEST